MYVGEREKITVKGEIKVDEVSIPLTVAIEASPSRLYMRLFLPRFYPEKPRENYLTPIRLLGELPSDDFLVSVYFSPTLTKEEDFFSEPIETFLKRWGYRITVVREDYILSGDLAKEYLSEYYEVVMEGKKEQFHLSLSPKQVESLEKKLITVWSVLGGNKTYEAIGWGLTDEVVQDLPNLAEEILRKAQSTQFPEDGALKVFVKATTGVSTLLPFLNLPPMRVGVKCFFIGRIRQEEERFIIPTVILKRIVEPYLQPSSRREDVLELPDDVSLDRQTIKKVLTSVYLLEGLNSPILAAAIANPEKVEVTIVHRGWETLK